MFEDTKMVFRRYTDSGQKFSYASDFPYVFHIKIWFFK